MLTASNSCEFTILGCFREYSGNFCKLITRGDYVLPHCDKVQNSSFIFLLILNKFI